MAQIVKNIGIALAVLAVTALCCLSGLAAQTAQAAILTPKTISSSSGVDAEMTVFLSGSRNIYNTDTLISAPSGLPSGWHWGTVPSAYTGEGHYFISNDVGLWYKDPDGHALTSKSAVGSPSFELRFKGVIMSKQGELLDLGLTFSDFSCSGTSGYSQNYFSVLALRGTHISACAENGRAKTKFKVTTHYYKTGTNTTVSGCFYTRTNDLDVTNDTCNESVFINSSTSAKVYWFSGTKLTRSESGSYTVFSDGDADFNSDGGTECSLIYGLNNGSTFWWQGAACGTNLLVPFSPLDVYAYKTELAGSSLSMSATPGSRTVVTDEEDSKNHSLVWGWLNSPTYTAKPDQWSKLTWVKVRNENTGSWSDWSNVSMSDPYGSVSYTFSNMKADQGFNAKSEPKKAYVTVSKSSSHSWTGGLKTYQLNEAQFSIYKWWSDVESETNAVETFKIKDKTKSNWLKTNQKDASNKGSTANGYYYYVKETAAPPGFKYPSTRHQAFYTWDGSNETVSFTDPAVYAAPTYLMTKYDADLDRNYTQGDASFDGCQWEVKYYDDYTTTASNAAALSTARAVWKTVDGGKLKFTNAPYSGIWPYKNGTTNVMPLGTYVIKEIAGNDSYSNTSNTFVIRVTQDATSRDAVMARYSGAWVYDNNANSGYNSEQGGVHKGTLKVVKIDKDLKRSTAQGDATFAGIQCTVYNWSSHSVYVGGKEVAKEGEVGKITLAADGTGTLGNLPYGTYRVKETSVGSTGYLLNSTWCQDVVVHPTTASGSTYTVSDSCPNTVIRGNVSGNLHDNDWKTGNPQGDATLKGAVFEFVNKSTNSVVMNGTEYAKDTVCATAITAADGTFSVSNLPYGTYLVRQKVKTDEGYIINTNWSETISVREQGVTKGLSTACPNPVMRGTLSARVKDADWVRGEAQGDATLKGAVLEVKNVSAHAVHLDGVDYESGVVVGTMTTDAQGNCSFGNLPYGTYTIRQVKAPDAGYLINNDWSETITVREDGVTKPLATDCLDAVMRGAVSGYVMDFDWHDNQAQGDATLTGAVLEITNQSVNTVHIDGVDYAKGAVVGTMETDKYGYCDIPSLPYGTYSVRQAEAPDYGYHINPTWHETISVRKNNAIHALMTDCLDQVIRGNSRTAKVDAETGFPQGDATFDGITFQYKLVSDQAVYYKGNTYKPGSNVDSQPVDAISGELVINNLPYGTYVVTETISDTCAYHTNGGWSVTIIVREEGETIDSGQFPCADEVWRSGIDLQKIDSDCNIENENKHDVTLAWPGPQGNAKLEGAVFAVYNVSMRPVFVRGKVWETHAGTPIEQMATKEPMFTITTNEKGRVQTALKELPYGTYVIREITAPEGYLFNDDYALGVVVQIREDNCDGKGWLHLTARSPHKQPLKGSLAE